MVVVLSGGNGLTDVYTELSLETVAPKCSTLHLLNLTSVSGSLTKECFISFYTSLNIL